MGLLQRLDECNARGQALTMAVAEAQFGNDSPEARTISRRWGIQEASEMVGVTQPTIRAAELDGRLPVPDMVMKGRVEQRAG